MRNVISKYEDNIVQRTKELIRYKTVRPAESDPQISFFTRVINDCMDYINTSLHKNIIIDRAETYNTNESFPVLLAKFNNRKDPDLLLIGHIDVVAGEEKQFCPYESSGRIYGRGSKDMKAGIAAMIEIMNFYAGSGFKPNIAMAIVSDEETGGYNGANIIVNKLGYRPKFVISPDPGEEHNIIHKEKGFIWAGIKVKGRSCHPSRPWLGECAYTNNFRVLEEISSRFNTATNEKEWKTTLSLRRMDKIFENGMPDHSSSIAGMVNSRIDIRYTENENAEDIIAEIHSIIKKYNAENSFEVYVTAPVCFTPESNEHLINFVNAAESIENKKIPLTSSCGASDLRFFAEKKIPCINFGPHGKNHHGRDEYVEINSIIDFYHSIIKYTDDNILEKF